MKDLRSKIQQDDEIHYYTASFGHWATSKDLETCLAKQKSADKCFAKKRKGKLVYPPVHVFLVPKPEDTKYEISNYEPQDVGATLIAIIKHEDWYDDRNTH